MLKNYFKTAWRNVERRKANSIINIVGLSAGLTCFTLISLWVADELSYDTFNSNYHRIVRLTSTTKTETGIEVSAVSSAPMAKALKDDYPEIEEVVRLRMREEIITHNKQQVLQPGILVTDPSFFRIFSYRLKRGHENTALSEPYSIILTESLAKKYFGESDPMGQTLVMNMYDTGYGATYKITGVMADPPKNAHFTFTMLASFRTIEVANPDVLTVDGWGDASFYTYLLLKNGVEYKTFSKKITQFYGKYIGADLFRIWRNIYSYQLQPLKDIYLKSNLQYEIGPVGSINRIYIFSTIGIFVLLLAGINYTNLATAVSVSRAREVGIKKVAGAGKQQLIFQFLLESVSLAILALIVSILLTLLLRPFFFQLTGKDLSLLSSPPLLLFLLGMTAFLGFISGVYPAIVLSSYKPATVLKGSFKSSEKGILLRRTLVVSQFVITVVLVAGIVIIYEQMAFIKHKDLGFDKDALLYLRVHGNTEVVQGYNTFKNELENSPLIFGMTTSNSLIGGGLGTGGAETVDEEARPLQVNTARIRVDSNYFNVYGIRFLAGGNFNRNPSAEGSQQIVLNETAVRKFGWGEPYKAIGKPFKIGGRSGTVVGVTNNFHYESLQQEIQPLAITSLQDNFSRISLRVDVSNAEQVISLLESKWKKHFSTALFDYGFLNEQIQQQYEAEEKFSDVFLYFSLSSLLIACLGLYGLISHAVLQKRKEISIRKILGASAQGIAAMLSVNFLKPVLIACIIAVPVIWYIMHTWLQNFAYRIQLSWWMFVAGGLLVLLTAIITVGLQAGRAAIANPVKSLRTE